MADRQFHLPPVFTEQPAVCIPGEDGRCALCADEGTPGRVLALRPGNMAWVELPGGPQEVALDLVDGVDINDWVLVHLGFAIAELEGVGAPLATNSA